MTKVNKENWEYRKIGDLCTVISGSTPKTNIEEYWGPGYYWVTPAELGEGIYIDKTERMITDEALKHTHLTLLPEGTVLLSSRAPIGKVAITTVPMYCNQGFKNMVCSKDIYNKYLYWFLKHKTEYLQSLGRGATFKEISKKIVENIEVTYYNFNKQKRIAALFDIIDNLITIKQKQLKEFDSLESSVFIKMFGDSVVKEMGWEVKSLGEIGNIITGSTPSTKDKENYEPKEYCFVKPSDLPSKGVANITTTEYFVSSKGFALSRALPIGSVLISCIGTIGKIGILKQVACSNQQINAIIPNRTIDSYYLAYNIAVNKNKLESMANAPVVPIINKTSFSLFKIAIPPLTLQQSFAQKIEVIEKQKEVVKNEIAQLQALLDSEMDKYFG